ncbi:MAG: Lon protease family protein [Alphaproteobacteria bacterium]
MTKAPIHSPLSPDILYRYAADVSLNFKNTDEIEPLNGVINQQRAMQALDFAMQMPQKGYNLFAVGPYGTGKRSLIMRWLKKVSLNRDVADDWGYVYNFDDGNEPIALKIPRGKGQKLKEQIEHLVEDLTYTIPSIFEGDEYRSRYNKLNQEYNEQQDKLFKQLADEAFKEQVVIQPTETGFSVIPCDKEGELLSSEDVENLGEDIRHALEDKLVKYREELQEIVSNMPLIERKRRQHLKELEKEVVTPAIDHLIAEISVSWQDNETISAWLASMRKSIVNEPLIFIPSEEQGEKSTADNDFVRLDEVAPLRKFRINLIVDHSCSDDENCGSPIVYCENPSLANLIGHVEYVPKYTSQLTDFNLIKAGALHKANGGCLIIEAEKLLAQPMAWEALKRALNTGYIAFDMAIDQATTSILAGLNPQKIPLNVKVILLGDQYLLSMLSAYDSDFNELFKVVADFDTEIPRDDEGEILYGRFIALVAKEENLKSFSQKAVARVIEYGSRMVESQNKLTAHMALIVNLLREGNQLAAQSKQVECKHIDAAIEGRIFRSDKIRFLVQEQIKSSVLNIETQGYKVGQINGLSVLATDRFAFGQPARITALVWPGKAGIVDIEREVDLGGSLHSKGVMILSSYLASSFAQDFPLSLAASLTFEQSYYGVDGDSASSAEAYALLSALSDIPINQAIAVTGALDQKGNIQAIGGVNEKIEGFFDICHARGLSGEQGVIIPKSNEQNLMLAKRVRDAAKEGKFHIWSVGHVHEGIEILTEHTAEDIYNKTTNRLKKMAEAMKSFK